MEPRKIPTAIDEVSPPIAGSPAPLVVVKRPGLAAVLSLFPGMGNIYNGLYVRGTTIFITFLACIYLASHGRGGEVFGPAAAFTVIFGIIDAYRQATLINYGYAEDPGARAVRAASSAGEKVFSGILLLVLGLLAALRRYFEIDLEWLVELWPLALVAVGGWLLWSAWASKRQADGESGPGAEV